LGWLVGGEAADGSIDALSQRAPGQRVRVKGGEEAWHLGIPTPLLAAACRAARRAARRVAAPLEVEATRNEERVA
jgi:hypothetical protein